MNESGCATRKHHLCYTKAIVNNSMALSVSSALAAPFKIVDQQDPRNNAHESR